MLFFKGKGLLLKDNSEEYIPFGVVKYLSVEANFGNDLKTKPFKYDISKHLVVKEFYWRFVFIKFWFAVNFAILESEIPGQKMAGIPDLGKLGRQDPWYIPVRMGWIVKKSGRIFEIFFGSGFRP